MGEWKVAIAGMHIESGTLSPLVTRYDDFLRMRGEDMLERYPWIGAGYDWDKQIDWVPLVHFRAMPGGVVVRKDYERMKAAILEGLAGGEWDGFYLDMHGAMVVEGVVDAELDLVQGVRGILGDGVPVACSQDLHGNVSAEFVAQVDAITTYRTAPHLDVFETRERAAMMMARMLVDGVRPARVWLGIPVLLSGEMTSTEVEPGRSLWSGLDDLAGDGVWDVSLWAGYPWADEARAMASVVATGIDVEELKENAMRLAQRYWDSRGEFEFLSPAATVEEALSMVDSLEKPVFLSDAGDNPTAGGAGDTTGVLRAVIEFSAATNRSVIFASIPDSDAVRYCMEAGVGAEVELSLGGKLDPVHSGPLDVVGRVVAVSDRDARMGPEVVLGVGGCSVILSSRRRPYHLREDYVGLGLDPLETDVTVVKIGYLEPELRKMAGSHVLLLSDGGVNPALREVEYRRVKRPMFPLDEDFDWVPEAVVFSRDGR